MGVITPNNKGFFAGRVVRLWNFFRMIAWAGPQFISQLLTRHKKLSEIPLRSGKVCVITGGARGIGAEVVKQLLQADMRVIIGCRDMTRGNKMIKQFRKSGIADGSAECIHLDLESLYSVDQFAKSILALNIPIHLLINNAGIMFAHYKVTVDGFESHFQVNYLSHFFLTLKLLPALTTGAGTDDYSRVVNVSSAVACMGHIDLEDILMKKFFCRHAAYPNTKLLQVISSNYLNSKFIKEKVPIRSYAVHPGMIDTGLYDNCVCAPLIKLGNNLYARSVTKGADMVAYVALSPAMEDKGGTLVTNYYIIPWSNPQMTDHVAQSELWKLSHCLTKLDMKQESNAIVPDPFLVIDIE